MKTITIKISTLDINASEMYDINTYPKEDGLYIVNDSIAYYLVGKYNGLINTISLPSKQVVDNLIEANVEGYRKEVENIKCEYKQALNETTSKLDELKQLILNMELPAPAGTMDINALTKLVAVAQSPELVKSK
jgi:hypothetical protein